MDLKILEPIFSSEIFLYCYIVAVTIQLIHYWLIFSRFAFYRKKRVPDDLKPVSVVISAKNEYRNLKKNLPIILNQDHPDFEVVVVNDASDDETVFLLEDFDREYDNLKIVTLKQDLNFFTGKKFPLAIGIKSAQHEYLLLTDADCSPSGNRWIRSMVSGYAEKDEIVLGYGKHRQHKGILNKIIRFETAFTAIQYFSYALLGLPYMGVGRNLSYKKSVFIKNKGFISHYNVSSGDDDLFINKVANKQNTSIEVSPESFTISDAKETFTKWWIQKRRHLSTGKYYKFKHKILLGSYSFSLFILFLLFIILLIVDQQIILATGLLGLRLTSQLIVYKISFSKLLEKKLLLISPLIELLLLVIYPVIILANLIIKESKWK